VPGAATITSRQFRTRIGIGGNRVMSDSNNIAYGQNALALFPITALAYNFKAELQFIITMNPCGVFRSTGTAMRNRFKSGLAAG
jgi:hypothetical protein